MLMRSKNPCNGNMRGRVCARTPLFGNGQLTDVKGEYDLRNCLTFQTKVLFSNYETSLSELAFQ